MFELNIPAIMLRRLLLFTLSLAAFAATAQITVEQCVDLARENYPLIQKYDLLHQTRSIDLSDINKTWLPQLNAYGQATVQNAVPSFPTALSDIMDRMGTGIPGMEKVQYKVGVDVGQTIWDGGISKSRREVEEAMHAERTAALDVQLYAVRERVENLFFSILLLEEQTAQARLTQTLLESNLAMLRTMKANGTAMQSDVDMLEAQYLSIGQQITQTESAALTYRTLLELYTGKDMSATPLVKPQPIMPDTLTPARPELNLFAAQTQSNDARSGNLRAAPRRLHRKHLSCSHSVQSCHVRPWGEHRQQVGHHSAEHFRDVRLHHDFSAYGRSVHPHLIHAAVGAIHNLRRAPALFHRDNACRLSQGSRHSRPLAAISLADSIRPASILCCSPHLPQAGIIHACPQKKIGSQADARKPVFIVLLKIFLLSGG